MNLIYGQIVEIGSEAGIRTGKVRIGGAIKPVVLELVTQAAIGEWVLLCDDIAISKIENNDNGKQLCVWPFRES